MAASPSEEEKITSKLIMVSFILKWIGILLVGVCSLYFAEGVASQRYDFAISLAPTSNVNLKTTQVTKHNQYPPGQWDRIIENEVFTRTLRLDEGDDNVLIIGSEFHSIEDDHAITLRDVSNIYIKDCLIHDIGLYGIKFQSTGSTRNVTIDGCKIYNTQKSGILAPQRSLEEVDHPGLVIKNNLIYNNGDNKHEHGIYVQTTDSLIENNIVYGSSGNGISIRSSGIVRGNIVWNTVKSCIRYHSDHAPGPSNAIYIENNICYHLKEGLHDSAAISLLVSDRVPSEWLLDNYFIRFNTVVVFTKERYGFSVQSEEFHPKRVEVYGNLFINTEDIAMAADTQYVDEFSKNYVSILLSGFVNSTQEPYDFHLTVDSPARNYATGLQEYPSIDIDGDIRLEAGLDAGADQYLVLPTLSPSVVGSPSPIPSSEIAVVPTPLPSLPRPSLSPSPLPLEEEDNDSNENGEIDENNNEIMFEGPEEEISPIILWSLGGIGVLVIVISFLAIVLGR